MGWNMQVQVIGEVAVAMLLGGLIGLEREIADKPAGFRTQMLVAGAAALLVGIADAFISSFRDFGDANLIQSDPIRVVEAIITGISFLGAGTIFRRSRTEQVEGLTTAASILLCSGIGICVALDQKVVAVGVTLLALVTLRGLSLIVDWIKSRRSA